MTGEMRRTREEICSAIATRMSEDDETITETRPKIPPVKTEIERLSEEMRYLRSEVLRLQAAAPQRVPLPGNQLESLGPALTGIVVKNVQIEMLKEVLARVEQDLASKRLELAELEMKLEIALANWERMAGEFRQNRCGEIVSPALVLRPL